MATCRLRCNKIKRFKENHIAPLPADQEDLALSGEVSKNAIDFLSKQIAAIENVVLSKVKLKNQFLGLQTIPGLGKILAMTIMLETGKIERFTKVGNFSSYCRKVPSKWTSNDVKKGKGNVKNGNKYLAWAFSEVAEFARRYDESATYALARKNCVFS